MKNFVALIFLLVSTNVVSQNIVEWDGNYKLNKSDFKASSNGVFDGFMMKAACTMDFSFYMNSYEFMFTKNFNSKARTIFTKDASYIITSDTVQYGQLIKLAQAEFDLTELFTRKFRKEMYENKKVFSEVKFYQEAYNKIQSDFSNRETQLVRDSNMGKAEGRLNELHEQILKEIDELRDFCKECKVKKKK